MDPRGDPRTVNSLKPLHDPQAQEDIDIRHLKDTQDTLVDPHKDPHIKDRVIHKAEVTHQDPQDHQDTQATVPQTVQGVDPRVPHQTSIHHSPQERILPDLEVQEVHPEVPQEVPPDIQIAILAILQILRHQDTRLQRNLQMVEVHLAAHPVAHPEVHREATHPIRWHHQTLSHHHQVDLQEVIQANIPHTQGVHLVAHQVVHLQTVVELHLHLHLQDHRPHLQDPLHPRQYLGLPHRHRLPKMAHLLVHLGLKPLDPLLMDLHIPKKDHQVVHHLELPLQDLQHPHKDQVMPHRPSKGPCPPTDPLLPALPIRLMAHLDHKQVLLDPKDLLVHHQVDLQVVLIVVLQADLKVDPKVDHQVHQLLGHLVDPLADHRVDPLVDHPADHPADHLAGRQVDHRDIPAIQDMVLHMGVLPITIREDLIQADLHPIKGTHLTLEAPHILDMDSIQATLDPLDLPILKLHLHMVAHPMEVPHTLNPVGIQEAHHTHPLADTHPRLAKVIHLPMVNIQGPLEVIIPHHPSIIKATHHHRRRAMDNTGDPILQDQEVKWVLLIQVIQEVPLAHLQANTLVTIKQEVAILVIQVVHLDPILDLAVLLQLEHLVDPLVVPQVQHPQQVGPRLDLQQERHLRPQFPVPLNKNRILKKLL